MSAQNNNMEEEKSKDQPKTKKGDEKIDEAPEAKKMRAEAKIFVPHCKQKR